MRLAYLPNIQSLFSALGEQQVCVQLLPRCLVLKTSVSADLPSSVGNDMPVACFRFVARKES
jgi:hypothetical protein